jgi:ABC-type transport system involved in multi-copper enzyme maturation permease subunit
VSLFNYEMKKILFNRKTMILAGVMFILYGFMGFFVNYLSLSGANGYRRYAALTEAATGELDDAQLAVSTAVYDDAVKKYGSGYGMVERAAQTDPELRFHVAYVQYAELVDEYYNGSPDDPKETPYGIYPLQTKLDTLEKSSFEYKAVKAQLDKELALGAPVFANTVLWQGLFSQWGGIMVILLLFFPLAYIISPVFSGEASSGMDNIILSSKSGRRKIVTAKLAALITSSAIMIAIFLAATFLGIFLSVAPAPEIFAGWDAPLRSIPDYARSPVGIQIWQYALVSILWLLFAGIIFSLVMTLISSKTRLQMAAFGIGVFILLGNLILSLMAPGTGSLYDRILDFGFVNLGQSSAVFFRYTIYNLFGLVTPFYLVGIGVLSILGAISIWLVYRFQKTRMVA